MTRSIDIHGVLSARKLKIAQRRQVLTEKYQHDLQELREEEKQIEEAFAVIAKAVAPYLCKRCHGSGTIRVCDAAGDMDDDVCPDCRGTGVRLEDGGQDE